MCLKDLLGWIAQIMIFMLARMIVQVAAHQMATMEITEIMEIMETAEIMVTLMLMVAQETMEIVDLIPIMGTMDRTLIMETMVALQVRAVELNLKVPQTLILNQVQQLHQRLTPQMMLQKQ